MFYLNRELLQQPEIAGPFAQMINEIIITRDANAVALFMPTDMEEKVECINPQILSPEQSSKVDSLIEKIEKDFQIGNTDELIDKKKD